MRPNSHARSFHTIYYADGRVNHAYDVNDNRFDRKLDYDDKGRLKEAYTGPEARGQAPTVPANSPFRQTFDYDEWSNMKTRSGRLWKQPLTPESSEYGTDDRRDGWGYDAAGNLTESDSTVNSYDAAGSQTYSHPPAAGECGAYDYEIVQEYDGEGRPAKRVQTTRRDTSTDPSQVQCATNAQETYYVYSAALGGAKLLELNTFGQKTKGYIYGGGTLLAKQEIYPSINSSGVKWQHPNPGSSSWVETASDRAFERQEMDPLGQEVGTADPFLIVPDPNYSDIHGDTPMFVDGGDPFHLSDGCGDIDGMPASCEEISERSKDGTLGGESVVHGSNGWSIRRYNIDGFGGVPRIFVSGGGVDTNPTWASDDDDHPVQIATDKGHWENLYFRQPSRTPAVIQQTLSPRTTRELDKKLSDAVLDAYKALSEKESCRNLFGGRVDPRDLLMDLYTGQHNVGSITFGDLGATGTAARTSSRQMGSLRINTNRVSIPAGADIVINSNEAGAYRAGYKERELGANVSDRVRRAITLLHELGHAARDLYDTTGSQIQPDDESIKDHAKISLANSKLVYENCFR